ncbi:MAG: hypothetical protein E6Q97_24655 [Desulfurellales bacterium]|nr:MAG: hypothetical protein E6Q97_24655 [Desulfurellales bacterium]
MATIFRAPVYFRATRKRDLVADFIPNLLTATLAVVVVAAPFTSRADTQVERQPQVFAEQALNLLLSTLAPQLQPIQPNSTLEVRRKPAATSELPPNLLHSTLSVQAAPFAPTQLSELVERQRVYQDSLAGVLPSSIPAVLPSGAAELTPAPTRQQSYQIEQFGFLVSRFPVPVYPTDLSFVEPKRDYLVDQIWANALDIPARAEPFFPALDLAPDFRRPAEADNYPRPAVLDLVPATAPFTPQETAQTDRRRGLAPADSHYAQQPEAVSTPVPFLPAEQLDPPHRRALLDWSPGESRLLLEAAPPPPFAPTEQLSPAGRRPFAVAETAGGVPTLYLPFTPPFQPVLFPEVLRKPSAYVHGPQIPLQNFPVVLPPLLPQDLDFVPLRRSVWALQPPNTTDALANLPAVLPIQPATDFGRVEHPGRAFFRPYVVELSKFGIPVTPVLTGGISYARWILIDAAPRTYTIAPANRGIKVWPNGRESSL